jgi:magnesium chelatase family protein
MFCAVQSFVLDGIAALKVRVEVEVKKGLPYFHIAGLPDAAQRESRERVRAALVNSGFELPLQHVAVSVCPSTNRAVPGLDLAIAVALLKASGQITPGALSSVPVVGELALDGSVRGTPGVLAFAAATAADRRDEVMVPAQNGSEATLVKGIEVIALDHLYSMRRVAAGEREAFRPEPLRPPGTDGAYAPDLSDLRGQRRLRRALTVAAAGNHGLVMLGARGSGKSLAASRLPSILPPMSEKEAFEVALVSSCTGQPLQTAPRRPFRAPHHTISAPGLAGGVKQPGEVTRAHRGVLFLDDLGEFRRDSLEALDVVLATWETCSPARPEVFPTRALLVAGAEPCLCGRGESDPDCECAPTALRRYRTRLEAAIEGMFEIRCPVEAPSAEELSGPPGESSAEVRTRVCAARELQAARLGEGVTNADMDYPALNEREFDSGAVAFLNSRPGNGVRGGAFERLLRVSQTIADLDGCQEIERRHLEEALSLTAPERR